MSQFNLIEVKSVNGKDYFIEGYVSTIDPDFVNDIVDENGQEATYNEIINSDITMDEDHNEWRDPETGKLYDGKKNRYPLAVIKKAKLDSKGTWVKAKLNKNHPDFYDRILPMIKDKMLHSFSIAYSVKKSYNKIINNIKHRIIQDLKIANIALTGNPVNKNATFDMALKSFSKMDEDKKMEKTESQSTEEMKGTDYKKMYEELKAKYDKMMSDSKKNSEEKEMKSKEATDKKEAEMKSFNDKVEALEKSVSELVKENAELKSIVESPQLKSIVEAKSKAPQTEAKTKSVTMWDAIE